MIWIGYEIGRWFDWSTMDSLFLGAILAISSTTIIVKALNDLKMKNERFAQLIFGVLIVEDILGIGIIALLSSIAVSGTVSSGEVFSTVGKLSLFMIVALVIGILLVPRLLAYVAKFESNEMLLITVLGLCFGFCLLVVRLEYSMVLGAFLIGAIMAESRQLLKIEQLIEPVRDLFSAIFFVAIGLMLDNDPAAIRLADCGNHCGRGVGQDAVLRSWRLSPAMTDAPHCAWGWGFPRLANFLSSSRRWA